MPQYQSQPNYEHDTPESIGILMVNLGTPDAPTSSAVRRYLAEFLSDPRIVELPRALWWMILYGFVLPLRPRRSAKLYQKIWHPEHGSPLLMHSQALVNAVQAAFDEQGNADNLHVECAMRYGNPSIASALDKLAAKNCRHLCVIPLFPQYSATTSASVFDAVSRHLQQQRWLPQVHFLSGYHDDPQYIEALANSIKQFWAEKKPGEKLLFSFHGIPKRNFDKGDPYYCFCHKTARKVAEALALTSEQWQVVFQSRFGAQPWLQPYCDETLKQLPKDGIKKVDVVCPGFAVDCLETLEEINIGNKTIFEQAGGQQYHYIPALNANPDHVQCFTDIIRKAIQPWLKRK